MSDRTPEPPQDFHFEEYRALHQEILEDIQETRKLEIYALIGLAAVCSWISTQPRVHPVLGYFPMLIPILAGMRCWTLYLRIRTFCGYKYRLENAFATEHKELPGWEHYWRTHPNHVLSQTVAFWVAMIVASVAFSYITTSVQQREYPVTLTAVENGGGHSLYRHNTFTNQIWKLDENDTWQRIPDPEDERALFKKPGKAATDAGLQRID